MAELNIIDHEKLADLRGIRRPQVFELVKVQWPIPDGTRYYCSTQLNELPGYAGTISPVETRLPGYAFQQLSHISDIADDQVQLEFSDIDGEMTRLFYEHGEGVKVEVIYYFPEVDLEVSQWWGHLRPPDEADGLRFRAKAQSGFRSANLPLPRRFFGTLCPFIFGGHLSTQAEIDQSGCPWNLHIGGSTGAAGSESLPPCPRTSRSVCTQYLGDDLSYGGFETLVESIVNNQTKGASLLATSRGNETNLKRPLRVIYGFRRVRDLDLLAYTPQLNNNHPDQGFVRCLFAISEGPVQSVSNCKVNGTFIGFQHLNTRTGELRQSRTAFSPNVNNYSGTALFFGVYGPVNASQYGAGNLSGEADINGRSTIRVYSDASTYTEQYTNNRAWCLLDLYTNKRFGHGVAYSRFVIQDWIDLAEWCNETVGYADASGAHFTGTRSTFNAEINERSTQQHIHDICLFGRFGLPFRHGGKIRIVPLKREDLSASTPVFTDQGESRNIVVDGANSTLVWSQKSDADLVNQILLTFDDVEHGQFERPLTFEDQPAQLRAGRAFGDDTVRIVKEQYSAVGVTSLGEAARLGNLLLDLGPFDTGGLKNNLTIKFVTSDIGAALGLWKYKLIRVLSPKIARFGFEYFRVMERHRRPDLTIEITAQAYPAEYYDRLEDSEQPPPIIVGGGDDNPGGGGDDPPCALGFRTVQHLRDYLDIQLEFC